MEVAELCLQRAEGTGLAAGTRPAPATQHCRASVLLGPVCLTWEQRRLQVQSAGEGQVLQERSKAASAPGGRPPQALPPAPCGVLGAPQCLFPLLRPAASQGRVRIRKEAGPRGLALGK